MRVDPVADSALPSTGGSASADSHLVFVSMPGARGFPDGGIPWILYLVAFGVGLVCTISHFTFGWGGQYARLAFFVLMVLPLLALNNILEQGRTRRFWERELDHLSAGSRDHAVMSAIFDTGLLDRRRPFRPYRATYRAFVERLEAAGLQIPGAVAAAVLKDELLEIERPAVLLEPEAVGQEPTGSFPVEIVFIALLVTAVVWLFLRGLQLDSLLILGGIVLMSLESKRMCRLLGIEPSIDRLPVAGPGVISDSTGQRWSVHDAVMFVWAKKPGGGVEVVLLGEGRVLDMTFASTRDADFVTLWQRWNHPDPRPELLP